MGSFERLYTKKLEKKYNSKETIIFKKSKMLLVASIILWSIITITIIVMHICSQGGIMHMYSYPEDDYIYLETQAKRIISNNTIDSSKITDKNIEYSINYKDGICEIELLYKVRISATITLLEDGSLTMQIVCPDEEQYKELVTQDIFLTVFASAIFGFIIFYIIYLIGLVIYGLVVLRKKSTIFFKKSRKKFKLNSICNTSAKIVSKPSKR